MKGICTLWVLLLSLTASAQAAPPPEAPAPPKPSEPKLTPPKLSGYFQPAFTWGTGPGGPAGNFFIRRLIVKIAGEVFVPEVAYTFMFDPASFQKPLRDGFLSLLYVPKQELRLGQFKLPFGYEVPTSDAVLTAIENSVVTGVLGRGLDSRDYGVAELGSLALGEKTKFEHAVAVVNGAGANNLENTPRKDAFARIGIAHAKLIRAGISGASVQLINTASERETSFRAGADVEAEVGPAFLTAEYILGIYSEPTAHNRSGFYVLAGARLLGFEPFARFEQLSMNDADPTALQRRLTLGANYYLPSGNVRFMANYRMDLVGPNSALLLQGQLTY